MSNNSRSESYAAAGVDITAGYKAVELMKAHIKRTKNEGCLDDVGGFGGCFGLPTGMEEPVLVSGTDGCGTKVKLAILMDKHDTIGIDAVAMCVNDIICCVQSPSSSLTISLAAKTIPKRLPPSLVALQRAVCSPVQLLSAAKQQSIPVLCP